jgi:hypothetical protein
MEKSWKIKKENRKLTVNVKVEMKKIEKRIKIQSQAK